MFARFIRRPVLAIVISVVIVFLGLLSIKSLPVSQFPEIAPPRVMVSLAFPGASGAVLVNTTIIPLEQAINGVQGMRYMVSDATSAGEATIQVLFEPGVNPNDAIVRVKNRVDQVMNRLPPLVQLEGVIIQPVQPSMLMYVNLYSKDKEASEKFLFNYANVFLLPELKRITGIAQARIMGSRQYAMRIWLNPDRMRAYKVSTEDVMKSIADQSIIGHPGRIGRSSGITAQSLEYVLVYKGRFNEPEEYENVIVRATPDGETLYLKDIAKVELGSEFYDIYSNVDGYPAAAILFKQTQGSNASDVIEEVKEKLEALRPNFPPGMEYKISYDVSTFLEASIHKVLHTLFEAFILVALVVFIFLGDWRSTLIPAIAVPVSLIGTFFFMTTFGLTINMITLFALVLAIGIVVDNAIVVVEAVHAKMADKHLSPYAAVKEVLNDISGAIITITLVMTAVFVPVCFMKGPVGVFYRQFSITMASSIVLSGLVALTLTPVLCAMILKKHEKQTIDKTNHQINPFSRVIGVFNQYFDRATSRYVSLLEMITSRRLLTVGILAAFTFAVVLLNKIVPPGFIPNEDQGMIYAIIQTPPGSTLEKTNEVARKLQAIAEKIEGVDSVASLAGYEILTEGRGSNAGTCLISLKNWSERKHTAQGVIEELEGKSKDFGAVIEYFEPPAVPGFGAAGGISFRLLDKTGNIDYKKFEQVNSEFMANLKKREELTGLFTFYSANFPQFDLKLDTKIAMQKGLSVKKAMEDLNILVGSTYEQGFIRFGQFFKVYTQALPEFRRLPSDILHLYTKNEKDEMVPYSSFVSMEPTQGPNEITRYNVYTSSALKALPASGYTTGDAIRAVKDVARQSLPRGYDIGWEGLSYDEAMRGNEAILIFLIVLVFVYLILSAQYESFILPFAVIFSLPPGIFGSFLLLRWAGLANDIYAQASLIMLVGLLGKTQFLLLNLQYRNNSKGSR